MKFRVFLFFGWLTVFYIMSCSRNIGKLISVEVIEFDTFAIETHKTHHPTDIFVMGILGMAICENMMVAISTNPAALISIVDIETEKTLLEKGVRGRGPGEFLSISTNKQFVMRNGHICLWVYDVPVMKGLLIDITESVEKQTIVSSESWQLGAVYQQVQGLLILPNGERFVKFPVTYKDARDNIYYYPQYLYLSSDDKEVRELAFFKRGKFSISASEFENARTLTFNGIIMIKPDGSKVIDAFYYCDHLNFLDLKKNRGFSMHYSKGMSVEDFASASYTFIKQHYVGSYVDVAVTDDHVLALYSGNPEANNRDLALIAKSAIRIFDWDGNPLALVHVDRELINIAYDRRTKRLYALDPEENIVYYELDDVI